MQSLPTLFRTALVTGASGGLGQAFVDMLLKEGVEVWGTARDVQRLSRWKENKRFHPVALDLADTPSLPVTYDKAAEQAGGTIDLLINNAGFGLYSRFNSGDFANWEQHLQAHLVGSAALARAALGPMISRGRGSLVNVSSVAVDYPLPFMSAYNVSKAGLAALSESLIFETRDTGVTVIDFRPADYRTRFNQAMQYSGAGTLPTNDARFTRCWEVLERNLAASPLPERAATDLRRALLRNRSGTVYSGSFFQTRVAVLFAHVAPARLRRAVAARYFGAS